MLKNKESFQPRLLQSPAFLYNGTLYETSPPKGHQGNSTGLFDPELEWHSVMKDFDTYCHQFDMEIHCNSFLVLFLQHHILDFHLNMFGTVTLYRTHKSYRNYSKMSMVRKLHRLH